MLFIFPLFSTEERLRNQIDNKHMITATITSHGAGIQYWATARELDALHETLYHLSEVYGFETDDYQNILILSLSYEVRHAVMGMRDVKKVTNPEIGKETELMGFKVFWPEVLLGRAAIRQCAGYCTLTSEMIAQLDAIDAAILSTVREYDDKAAVAVERFFKRAIDMSDSLMNIMYLHILDDFVRMPAGKNRLRQLPDLICRRLNPESYDYRTLLYDLKKKAKELGCEPEHLEFPSDAFEWVKW